MKRFLFVLGLLACAGKAHAGYVIVSGGASVAASTTTYNTAYGLLQLNEYGLVALDRMIPGVMFSNVDESVVGIKTMTSPSGFPVTYGVTASSFTATTYVKPGSKTAAQLRAITPPAAGEVYHCSDCTTVPLCISTGTAIGAFAIITNKATACL